MGKEDVYVEYEHPLFWAGFDDIPTGLDIKQGFLHIAKSFAKLLLSRAWHFFTLSLKGQSFY